MAFEKGTGGRPKGAKNKKTLAVQAATADQRAIAAVERLALANRSENRSAAPVAKKAVSTPVLDKPALEGELIEGNAGRITPKEVMLRAMATAWDENMGHVAEAQALEDRAFQMQAEAATMQPEQGEKVEAFKVRVGVALSAASEVHKQAAEVRQRARSALDLALDCATRAAPYEHPKLAQTQAAVDHTVNITIRQF